MGWLIVALIVAGMYYWGRYGTQCHASHWRHGRCQLKPGHFPNLHAGRDGRRWR